VAIRVAMAAGHRVLAMPVLCYGIYLRFGKLPRRAVPGARRVSELMPGLRLHGLPLFNFRDGPRTGALLSFNDERPIELDARIGARSWDWQFAHPATLLRQPLTGTAYHFGYNWRTPE